jgi:hypothetical protein
MIENPIHNSAIRRDKIPPIIYHRRFLDEVIEIKSGLSELLKYEISKVIIHTTKDAMPKEVNKEIFLYISPLKT